MFKDYITKLNKKFDRYLVSCEFEVEIIKYTDVIKTEYFFNTSIVNMKSYLIYHIYYVFSRGRSSFRFFLHSNRILIHSLYSDSFSIIDRSQTLQRNSIFK